MKSKGAFKTIGEVCKFEGYKALRKREFIEGPYKVIGGGKKPAGFHNQFNKSANTILCAASGSSGLISRYVEPVWASECFSIHSNDENLNEEYLYNFLKYNQDKIYKLIPANSGRSHMYPKTISRLKIPLPSLEVQNQIVEELSQIEESVKAIEERISQLEREKEQSRKYYRTGEIRSLIRDSERIPIKDLFELEKGKAQSSKVKSVEHETDSVLLSIAEKNRFIEYNKYFEEAVFICSTSSGTSSGPFETKIKYYNGKFDFTNMLTKLNFINSTLNKKYIYYYLNTVKKYIEDKCGKGSSNKSLNTKKFIQILIPLPKPEIQQQCVEIYEAKEQKLSEYDIKIQNEKDYIEELKQLGKDVISSFCCSEE